MGEKKSRKPVVLSVFFILACCLTSCAKSGSSNDELGNQIVGASSDISGAVMSRSGGLGELKGWLVMMLEQGTGIARVAEVDSAGLFTLKHVTTSRVQTIDLISSDSIASSVTSYPGSQSNTVGQYFKLTRTRLPVLVYKGPIVSLQDTVGVEKQPPELPSSGGDELPDASQASFVDLAGRRAAEVMSDTFKVTFSELLEYIVVQLDIAEQTDGSSKTTLRFLTKVREGVSPLYVQVRGPVSMLTGATVETSDSSGNPTTIAFDKRLVDDGSGEDSIGGDGIYGRRVTLPTKGLPIADQVLFFQLAFDSVENPWYAEFPYLFPNITIDQLTATYKKESRTFSIDGTPFGSNEDYTWAVSIYNTSNQLLFRSSQIPASTKSWTPSEQEVTLDPTYSYEVVAELMEKVPEFPAYVIHTARGAL